MVNNLSQCILNEVTHATKNSYKNEKVLLCFLNN